MKKIRWFLDPARSADWNMAVDEALMEGQATPAALPVLRFYSWERPSISVGYFQKVEDISCRFRVAEKKIPLVRRMTGGGLVQHGSDLTFSLSIPASNPYFSTDVKTSYLRINEALRVGLKELYPKIDYADCKSVPSGRAQGGDRICFEAPSCYDLLIQGKKIVGASQRRLNGTLLHQSAVFLDRPAEELIPKILSGFKKEWRVEFEEMPLTKPELEKAGQKRKERYNLPEWGTGL